MKTQQMFDNNINEMELRCGKGCVHEECVLPASFEVIKCGVKQKDGTIKIVCKIERAKYCYWHGKQRKLGIGDFTDETGTQKSPERRDHPN